MARPRGVIHSWATEEDDDTEDGRYGRGGKQRIEDTGPLTKKRMETIDDEIAEACNDFIRRQHEAGDAVLRLDEHHPHALPTHTKPESLGQAGRWQSPYHDTMIDHDQLVGELLDQLDELGIADDTIVIYSTDNGPHMNSWPDGGMTPFRSEKNTQLGGCLPGPRDDPVARAHPRRRGVQRDRPAPRLAADVPGRRRRHHTSSTTSRRARRSARRLQGAHRRLQPVALPHRGGRARARARGWSTSPTTATCSPSGSTTGRSSSWSSGWRARCGSGPSRSSPLRVPQLYNLRTDPYERAAITSNTYYDWLLAQRATWSGGAIIMTEFLADVRRVPAAAAGGELHHRPGDGEARSAFTSRALTR